MKTYSPVVLLIEAIANSWTRCLPPPYGTGEFSAASDKITDCNRFTYAVLERKGYTRFWDVERSRPILANYMVEQCETNGDFLEVAGDVAQDHANTGAVVVAGWKNPNGPGHVCIVMPGIPEASGSWGIMDLKVPKVANVGVPERCRLDRKASFAFGKDSIPKYFVLTSSIPEADK